MSDTTEQPNQTDQNQQTEQGVPAVGFLVIAFTAETAGDDALQAMKEAKKQGQFYYEDAAVVRQDAAGKVHYQETGDMRTGKGAGAGALIGGILGILGGPAGIAIGAAAGAALGAAAAHGDAGFKDESLQTVGLALKPGTSAVLAITDDIFLRALQEQVSIEDIRTVVSNVSAELSAQLAANKNVAIGLLLTPEGLAFKEIAADETSAQVVGAVITDDAVAMGVAVVTTDGAAYKVVGVTAEGAAGEAGVSTDEGTAVVDVGIIPEENAPAEAGDADNKSVAA